MFVPILFMTLIVIIMILIMTILPIINIHKKLDREKNSPFECGFDPFSKPRNSFSIHFFSISLMFLIFDIEITLLLPTPILMSKINILSWTSTTIFIMTTLLLGILIEWKEGSMNWK